VLSRGFWLLLYLIGAESRAQGWVLGLQRSHPNPWWIATVYGDLETWMPAAVVDELLTQAEQQLAAEAANPREGRELWRPLRILWRSWWRWRPTGWGRAEVAVFRAGWPGDRALVAVVA
jgi:hypothetical protein